MGVVYRAMDTTLRARCRAEDASGSSDSGCRPARPYRARSANAGVSEPSPHRQIYGIDLLPDGAGGQHRALVMELVDGEDLAQRIAAGPLPIDEALHIAPERLDPPRQPVMRLHLVLNWFDELRRAEDLNR